MSNDVCISLRIDGLPDFELILSVFPSVYHPTYKYSFQEGICFKF